jgi:FkbM family methyltransferase
MDNFFKDIRYCMPEFSAQTIFDVGANVGDFTRAGLKNFPRSRYFCFEPSSSTFDKLKNNVKNDNVSVHKIALSNINGVLPFTKSHSLCNSLVVRKKSDETNTQQDKLDLRMRALSGDDIETENVETRTLDLFCKDNLIDKIDILKIDTEGFDFEVLQGAKTMLFNKKIDLIYTELTFAKETNKFSNVFDVINFLWQFDYEVFRFYDQATVDGKLRRANVVLTSSPVRQYNTHNIWK